MSLILLTASRSFSFVSIAILTLLHFKLFILWAFQSEFLVLLDDDLESDFGKQWDLFHEGMLLIDEDAVGIVKGLPFPSSILPVELSIEFIQLCHILEIFLLMIFLNLNVILKDALLIQNNLSQ